MQGHDRHCGCQTTDRQPADPRSHPPARPLPPPGAKAQQDGQDQAAGRADQQVKPEHQCHAGEEPHPAQMAKPCRPDAIGDADHSPAH